VSWIAHWRTLGAMILIGAAAGVKGAGVTDIADGSILTDSGIQAGDVIEEINHQAVTTPQAAAARSTLVRKKSDPASVGQSRRIQAVPRRFAEPRR
jgi:S1-C subfamily serine protease